MPSLSGVARSASRTKVAGVAVHTTRDHSAVGVVLNRRTSQSRETWEVWVVTPSALVKNRHHRQEVGCRSTSIRTNRPLRSRASASTIVHLPYLLVPFIQHWSTADIPQRNAYIKDASLLVRQDTPEPSRFFSLSDVVAFSKSRLEPGRNGAYHRHSPFGRVPRYIPYPIVTHSIWIGIYHRT